MVSALRSLCGVMGQRLSALSLPPLSEHYAEAARQDVSKRNPLIVIPGILGSRIAHEPSGQVIWGSDSRSAYPDTRIAEDMRRASHPMEIGTPLHELTDEVVSVGAIEHFPLKVFGLPFQVGAYGEILRVLGVGGFLRDDRRVRKNWRTIEYDAASIASCFQFDYDWRRSIPENASRLLSFIDTVLEFAAYDATSRGVPRTKDDMRVDIVAHSMGGMLLRYLLRYGDQLLPDDGESLPKLTWEGVSRVDHAVLIGTPNAGSLFALQKLIEGLPSTPAMPGYGPWLLGSYPTLYQLLPRDRHGCFVEEGTGEPIDDLYTVERWARMGWGLLDPAAKDYLRMVLPDAANDAERTRIALDHTEKCLNEAERLHKALDMPVNMPREVAMQLFAGDGQRTPTEAVVAASTNGAHGRFRKHKRYRVTRTAPGDGTVTRWSALMDERAGKTAESPRLLTPIRWDAVTFIPTGHMGLTHHPTFVNNVLYTLLEKCSPECTYRADATGTSTDGTQSDRPSVRTQSREVERVTT